MTVLTCMVTLASSTNIGAAKDGRAIHCALSGLAVKGPMDLYLFWRTLPQGYARGWYVLCCRSVLALIVILMIVVFLSKSRGGESLRSFLLRA